MIDCEDVDVKELDIKDGAPPAPPACLVTQALQSLCTAVRKNRLANAKDAARNDADRRVETLTYVAADLATDWNLPTPDWLSERLLQYEDAYKRLDALDLKHPKGKKMDFSKRDGRRGNRESMVRFAMDDIRLALLFGAHRAAYPDDANGVINKSIKDFLSAKGVTGKPINVAEYARQKAKKDPAERHEAINIRAHRGFDWLGVSSENLHVDTLDALCVAFRVPADDYLASLASS